MLFTSYKYIECSVFFKTDFRFYWLQTKLQEESVVSQVSTNNSVSIIVHAHNLSEINVAINYNLVRALIL